jgi:pimeloyl-ACP methyl ester carboxylesterase
MMANYDSPAGFSPMPMAEAFAREGDGMVADTQAASLVALGAELAGEEAQLRVLEAGRAVRAQAPAELPPEIRSQLELPSVSVEKWQVTRATAVHRLDRDFGSLRQADTPGISALEPARTSLVIHGTFAAGNTWWQPGGDFHDYLRLGPRDEVYSGSDRFQWSGGFSDQARDLGARGLADWLAGKGAARADLFGHSHGASISMMATRLGMQARQLVLLSCPVMPQYFADFGQVGQVFSIRVWFDPVILIAGGGQRFPDHLPITEKVLPGFDHSSTHDPGTWRRHGLDQLIGAKA